MSALPFSVTLDVSPIGPRDDEAVLDEVARRMGRDPVRMRAVRAVQAREDAERETSASELVAAVLRISAEEEQRARIEYRARPEPLYPAHASLPADEVPVFVSADAQALFAAVKAGAR